MTTTTIGLLSAPETSDTLTTAPYHPEGFAHALLIDFSACEDHEYGYKNPIVISDAEKQAAYKLFLERLRRIVREDGQVHPPIDMVRFITTNTTEGPSTHTFRALDGLKPRHAEFLCGNLEMCEMLTLDTLKTPWPLESLLVSGLLDESELYGDACAFPAACRSLQALTLDFCCATRYRSPAGTEALRYLSISENDPLDQFVDMCKAHAGLETRLRTLVIRDMHPSEFSSRPFKDLLKQCASLTSLEMAMGPIYVFRQGLGEREDEGQSNEGVDSEGEGDDGDGNGSNASEDNQDMEGSNGDDAYDMEVHQEDQSTEDTDGPSARLFVHPREVENPWHGKEFPEEHAPQPVDFSRFVPIDEVMDLPQHEPRPAAETIWHELYQDLPVSLESFRFRGPPDMVGDLPKWLEVARQESWLPNLKTFSFRLDATGLHEKHPARETAEAAALAATQSEVMKFLGDLAASRPLLKIVA